MSLQPMHVQSLWNAVDKNETVDYLTKEFDIETIAHRLAELLSYSYAESLPQLAHRLKEAVLETIGSTGNHDLAECILIHISERRWGIEDEGASGVSKFSPHVTPLMLACLLDQHDMVRMLLRRGHKVVAYHHRNCKCVTCVKESQDDDGSVNMDVLRLDSYRALSSTAHLWNASHDPLNTACHLMQDLSQCANENNQLIPQYELLKKNVSQWAMVLLEQCRTTEEVQLVLGRQEGAPLPMSAYGRPALPQFPLAFNAGMNSMLCGSNVQTVLKYHWQGEWANQKWSWSLRYLTHALFYPITALLFALSGGKIVSSYKYPCARFISYRSSYLLFLLLLIMVTQQRDLKVDPDVRGIDQLWWKLLPQVYVWLYIFGMIIWDVCAVARFGLNNYFHVWWHCFDALLWSGFFTVSFFCWLRAGVIANADQLHKLHRKHWSAYDPTLLFEACYAAATICAFWRIFYFLQMFRRIGPTIISICYILKKLMVYIIIILIVIVTFAIGISGILKNYKGNFIINDDGSRTEHPFELTNPFLGIRHLYWAFFGGLWPTRLAVIVGHIGPNQTLVHHHISKVWAETLVGTYSVITFILLVKLVICFIGNLAGEIMETSEEVWKTVRCHVWAEFFEEANSVPPPFNVLYLLVSSIRDICAFSNPGRVIGFPEISYVEFDEDTEHFVQYQNLMCTLYARLRRKGNFITASAY